MSVSDDIPAAEVLNALPAEEQSALLRTLIDSALEAIIAHSPDGTLAFFNHATCEMLGYSEDEMARLGPFGWVAPGAMRGGAARLEAILHEGQLRFDSSAMCRDGRVLPTEVVARRMDSAVGPLVVAVIRDVSERTDAQKQLAYLAYHDSLTGLANRPAFEDRLALAIADANRHGDLLVLAYVDLDDFKPVNDSFGHDTGDDVLIEVGRRLAAGVREQDVVARLGGDEFVVLLHRVESVAEIGSIAERLLADIRRPIAARGNHCTVDASVGFAVFDPAGDDARALVVKADVAMYAAKHDSSRRWALWTPAMEHE